MKALFAGLVSLAFACGAQAAPLYLEFRAKGEAAFKARRHAQAQNYWSQAANFGDAVSHEKLGMLLLGPHAKSLGPRIRNQTTGIHHIYLAAVAGRPASMRLLSDALRRGASGAQKLPDAADCWALRPTDSDSINRCVAMTDFRDKRSRPACRDLQGIGRGAVAAARLCVANRTPALHVFSPPPGARDMMRASEFAKHGIEIMFAGDVFSEESMAYVAEFNRLTAEAIDATHGAGYLQRLGEQIERAINTKYP